MRCISYSKLVTALVVCKHLCQTSTTCHYDIGCCALYDILLAIMVMRILRQSILYFLTLQFLILYHIIPAEPHDLHNVLRSQAVAQARAAHICVSHLWLNVYF